MSINHHVKSGVIWVTGLPGAGKTTLSQALYSHFKQKQLQPILLDGDELRAIFANYQYDLSARKTLALQYARLCHALADQGHLVICATVSMFHEVRTWNRANNPHYCEVFLSVAIELLQARDKKGLYSQQASIPGISYDAEWPRQPDVTLTDLPLADLSLAVTKVDAMTAQW